MTAGEIIYNLYLEYVGSWGSDTRSWSELFEWEQHRWEQFAAVL